MKASSVRISRILSKNAKRLFLHWFCSRDGKGEKKKKNPFIRDFTRRRECFPSPLFRVASFILDSLGYLHEDFNQLSISLRVLWGKGGEEEEARKPSSLICFFETGLIRKRG